MIRNHSRHGSRFPVATAAASDPYWPYVSMLLHGDGTNAAQNNTFLDGSTNNFTVTRNGNTTQGSFNPFVSTYPYAVATNGGSGYFDGTGDYLTVPANAAFNLGTTSTTEMWLYPTASNAVQRIVGDWGISQPLGFEVLIYNGTIAINGIVASTSTTLTLNVWTHVAVVYNSGTLTIYFNGVSQPLVGVTTGYNITANSTVYVGSLNGSLQFFFGYMSNLRVVNGTALYTTTFTPPTAPLTAVTNTALLLGFTNGAIYDNAELNNLETVGSAQISTSVFKYGTGSIALNGTTDYLSTPAKTVFTIPSSTSFTIEAWIYITNLAYANGNIISANQQASSGYLFLYNPTLGLRFYAGSGAVDINQGSVTGWTANTWYHVAAVRNGASAITLYRNGVSVATGSSTSSFGTGPFYVGGSPSDAAYFNGYIDDFRFTNGIARYTTTFTPPTAAFPNS